VLSQLQRLSVKTQHSMYSSVVWSYITGVPQMDEINGREFGIQRPFAQTISAVKKKSPCMPAETILSGCSRQY